MFIAGFGPIHIYQIPLLGSRETSTNSELYATGKLRMLKPVIDELDNKFTTKETRHVQMIYTKHDYTVPEVLQY